MPANQFLPPDDGYPRSNSAEFSDLIGGLIAAFPQNKLCQKLDSAALNVRDYHRFLNMIFHQTFEGPSTFALAGANCDPRRQAVRDYLIEHAHEEKDHWQWVIEDLRATGFAGPDPRTQFPEPACQRYIAFNVYVAVRMPVARLAIAAFLEGVGATHGKKYATKLCQTVGLAASQAKFLFGHGDTDVGHMEDIMQVVRDADLTPYEWAWMGHAARTAASLYAEMYNGVIG
jgi:hypothetical protein